MVGSGVTYLGLLVEALPGPGHDLLLSLGEVVLGSHLQGSQCT